MKLEIPNWTSHHNMLVYAFFYYCEKNGLPFRLGFNTQIQGNGAILYTEDKSIFLDYSDGRQLVANPQQYDCYFKRSLMPEDYKDNVFPLNFHANYSYKSLKLLRTMKLSDLTEKRNRTEVVRALDYFNAITNLSHNAMDIQKIDPAQKDHGGKIIFQTRLWNPDNNSDTDEKARRNLQNGFRIEACRIIKKNFGNASVGIFPEPFAAKMAPDLLLDAKKTSKKEYFHALRHCDIGIADDGLKDTPGWKVSEYLLFGKALVSTPFNVVIEDFYDHKNFMQLSDRNSFAELPEKIDYLLKDRKYLEMGRNNQQWSNQYLHPSTYISRILSIIANK